MSGRKPGAGASAQELKLRAELDRAKRDLRKLKQAQGGGEAGELQALRAQVADLTAARQRLSKLYFGQVEENRRRSQKLHQILETIGQINSDLDLDAILQRLAATIRSSLGYKVVLIRLREPGTDRLRARAFAGIDEEGQRRLAQQDVRVADFTSWLQEEFRVSRSYFISHAHEFSRRLPAGWATGLGPREEWEWNEQDVLFVPLHDRDQVLLGYVSVDDPADRLVPSQEIVELLEVVGNHAVVAIENGRLYGELERHSRELEQANQRMQEMHALKSNFVSTVSHELRTPLTAIRAYVDTLLGVREGEMPHAQLLHFLSIVNEESDRLARLIESVLDLNRFDSGTVRMVRQRLDLATLCDEVIHQLWPMAEAGHVSLKEVTELADTHVEADRDQMRQLLLHLGSNGIKFTPPGGSVTFRIQGDAREVALTVEDTGIGIPKEALGKIFERFYQVDSSLARRFGGTGLGLAICKSIVEWHGGTIEARSEIEKGSSFRVTLPRRVPARVTMRPDPDRPAAVEDVLRLAIEMVADVMNARNVSLLAPLPDGDLAVEAAIGLEEQVVRDTRVPRGHGVAGWVAEQRRPVCVSDALPRAEVEGSGHAHYRSGTFLSVPLEGPGGLIGVLNVTDPCAEQPFGAEDCHLLLHLAARVAAAWDATRSTGAGDPFAEALRLLRGSPSETGAPVRRVELARTLARAMGLTEAEIGAVSYVASLGAAAGPPGADTAAPRALEAVGLVREIAVSVHEWWDGSGYPRGLAGESIPLGGRILAAVQLWDELTNGPSRRAALPREAALEELRKRAGLQLDPRVVDTFERMLLEPTKGIDSPRTRETAIAPRGGES